MTSGMQKGEWKKSENGKLTGKRKDRKKEKATPLIFPPIPLVGCLPGVGGSQSKSGGARTGRGEENTINGIKKGRGGDHGSLLRVGGVRNSKGKREGPRMVVTTSGGGGGVGKKSLERKGRRQVSSTSL